MEEAAQEAQKEVDRELSRDDFMSALPIGEEDDGVFGRTPFFQQSLIKSLAENNTLMDTVADIIVEITARGALMSLQEKEELFSSLLDCLSEDDVQILSDIIADHGYGDAMVQSLESSAAEKAAEDLTVVPGTD